MQETQVWSLGWEDPLEKGMATHSSILAWRIPRTEEPGGLHSTGSQRVRHDWATNTNTLSHGGSAVSCPRLRRLRCALWRKHGRQRSLVTGVSYGAAGRSSGLVNQQHAWNQPSLLRNTHQTSSSIDWLIKLLWPEAGRTLTLCFPGSHGSLAANSSFTATL